MSKGYSHSSTRGINWDSKSRKWRARINVYYDYIHLGYFSDINDALAARKLAEKGEHPKILEALKYGTIDKRFLYSCESIT
jgi:hypothetical protein